MTVTVPFLETLKTAASQAENAEGVFRQEVAERAKQFERERAFAFRRYNLMRAVADAVASAESEEVAVAAAFAILRIKLGWTTDSDARSEVLSHFAPVARSMFAGLSPADENIPPPDVIETLTEFETWYAATHTAPFWVLFEQYIPETPRVDF